MPYQILWINRSKGSYYTLWSGYSLCLRTQNRLLVVPVDWDPWKKFSKGSSRNSGILLVIFRAGSRQVLRTVGGKAIFGCKFLTAAGGSQIRVFGGRNSHGYFSNHWRARSKPHHFFRNHIWAHLRISCFFRVQYTRLYNLRDSWCSDLGSVGFSPLEKFLSPVAWACLAVLSTVCVDAMMTLKRLIHVNSSIIFN